LYMGLCIMSVVSRGNGVGVFVHYVEWVVIVYVV